MHAIIDELAPLGYKEDDLICALFVLEFGAIHTTAIVIACPSLFSRVILTVLHYRA